MIKQNSRRGPLIPAQDKATEPDWNGHGRKLKRSNSRIGFVCPLDFNQFASLAAKAGASGKHPKPFATFDTIHEHTKQEESILESQHGFFV
jgi:hypothetical protein